MNNIYHIYNFAQQSIYKDSIYKEFFNNSWYNLSLDWLSNDITIVLPRATKAALVEDLQ